jgi:hypothetical protein
MNHLSELYVGISGLLCMNYGSKVYEVVGVNGEGQWRIRQL